VARQLLAIKGFRYGKAGDKGAGNDIYPLLHLDDPILAQLNDNIATYTCNVDILGIPDDEATVAQIQGEAFMVALSIVEKTKGAPIGLRVKGFQSISVSQYTDDDAAGHRFTFNVVGANPVNRCEDYFDPTKQLATRDALPDFATDHPEGCAVFSEKNGLPNFKLDI